MSRHQKFASTANVAGVANKPARTGGDKARHAADAHTSCPEMNYAGKAKRGGREMRSKPVAGKSLGRKSVSKW